MPMGPLKEAPTFAAMMMKLQMGWDTLSKEHGLENVASKIIVDDVLLYGRTVSNILAYFRTVLNILKHPCTKLRMKNRKWFQDRYKFVGMEMASGGKNPCTVQR